MSTPPVSGTLDLTPVPPDQRQIPGRVKSLSARLKIDQYVEHREAFEFLQRHATLHGQGSRLVINSLLHYRDTVIGPLQANPELADDPDSPLIIARLAFRPLPPEKRRRPGRIKHVSVRVYIDRYVEHRQAAEFLDSQHETHGDGLKTVVRALLHFRDTVASQDLARTPAPARSRRAASRQLRLGGT